MAQRVLEGAWEEILRQSNELAGKRVRVTVIAEPAGDGAETRIERPSWTRFGMFPQLLAVTGEDFKRGEWRGEPDLDR